MVYFSANDLRAVLMGSMFSLIKGLDKPFIIFVDEYLICLLLEGCTVVLKSSLARYAIAMMKKRYRVAMMALAVGIDDFITNG
jgi:hypothetical protein